MKLTKPLLGSDGEEGRDEAQRKTEYPERIYRDGVCYGNERDGDVGKCESRSSGVDEPFISQTRVYECDGECRQLEGNAG